MTARTGGMTPIYEADSDWGNRVLDARRKLGGICSQCVNRTVRVQTVDGHVHQGVVVGHDTTYLHLATGDVRFLGPAAITTLVLYELLVITLLL